MHSNQNGPGWETPQREVSDQDQPKPDICLLAGMECRSCVQNSAAHLASFCQNLGPASLRDSFFKIYPDLACLPMARVFGRAYRAAQNQTESAENEMLAAISV